MKNDANHRKSWILKIFRFPKNVSWSRLGHRGRACARGDGSWRPPASAAPPSRDCRGCGGVRDGRSASGLSHAECDKSSKISKNHENPWKIMIFRDFLVFSFSQIFENFHFPKNISGRSLGHRGRADARGDDSWRPPTSATPPSMDCKGCGGVRGEDRSVQVGSSEI